MASPNAVETAKAFCGPQMYAVSAAHARVTLAHVSADADGLRLLAANGNWSEVLALAERLETEVAAKARRHPSKFATVPWSTSPPNPSLRVSPERADEADRMTPSASPVVSPSPVVSAGMSTTPSAAATTRLSTDAAVQSARLPYVLVQVTAHLKMRRIAAAKKVIDGLGDIEGEGFRHPITRESFAPFSLRLVAAFVPLYLGAPMEAQKKLYALLEECLAHERRCGAPSSLPSPLARSPSACDADAAGAAASAATVALQRRWTQRVQRVQRALLHVHVHMNQQSLAHNMVGQVLRSERLWQDAVHDLSDDLYELRHALQLQQLFFLALHVGDAQRALSVYGSLRTVAGRAAVPAAALSNADLCRLILLTCDAFLCVFKGEYSTAVQLLREVVDTVTAMKVSSAAAHPQASADGAVSEAALRRWVLQDVGVNAQVSLATCLPYCNDADPASLMTGLCGTLEGYAKAEPHVLCNSDAFVESLVRFYTLAGDRKPNLERLSDLLEVFRCDRGSLPSLEALV